MIQIDGSYLEGGGQIMRTALSLSAITKKAFKINKIRKGRSKPGIKEQHLRSIKLVSRICQTEEDASLGDKAFEFKPDKIEGKEFGTKIRTAGSTALLLNTVIPLTVKRPIKVKIKGGGTYNKFAPPLLYLKKILIPILEKFGYKGGINIRREGFYPKGGSLVEFEGGWRDKKSIKLMGFEKPDRIEIDSIASTHLEKARVAERQARKAEQILSQLDTEIEKNIQYVEAYCPGSGLLIYDNNLLASDSLGERGKPSEKVAEEAAEEYLEEIENKASIDYHGADQLMIYMALTALENKENSKIKTSKITRHAKTNAYVIEKFLPVKFEFKDNIIKCRGCKT